MMRPDTPQSDTREQKTIFFAVADANGRYISTGSAPAGSVLPEGAVPLSRPADPRADYHDHESGAAVEMPRRPSGHHKFDYVAKAWFDARTTETEWVEVRRQRDALLKNTDFTQLPDYPKNKASWSQYRQALRDITQQPDPFNLTWPDAPTS